VCFVCRLGNWLLEWRLFVHGKCSNWW
jgi:hypothetical protein